MNAESRSASAGLLLGALLLGIAWPTAAPLPLDCAAPFERRADAGSQFTTQVGCAGDPHSHPAVRGPARLLFGQRLDLNRASAAALEALPAIGPARAAAIARARAERPFRDVSDLQRVPGIGRKTMQGLGRWAKVVPAAGQLGADLDDREARWTDR